jgi:hypothetical protein
MEDWANAVLDSGDVSKCYPIEAAPTRENAEMLKGRIKLIRESFIPHVECLMSGAGSGGGENR